MLLDLQPSTCPLSGQTTPQGSGISQAVSGRKCCIFHFVQQTASHFTSA